MREYTLEPAWLVYSRFFLQPEDVAQSNPGCAKPEPDNLNLSMALVLVKLALESVDMDSPAFSQLFKGE